MKETCIRCGRETEYEVSTPVTVRRYYVEGSGHLCEKCFYELYPVPRILGIPCCSGLLNEVQTADDAGVGIREMTGKNRPDTYFEKV